MSNFEVRLRIRAMRHTDHPEPVPAHARVDALQDHATLGLMRIEVEPVKRAGMKEHVRRFKSLAVGLKEIEKFIRRPEQLWTGKPLKGLGGMRPREVVGNWLMCAVLSFEKGQPWCFTSDPNGW
jgi:hypothetical protein